uniref:Uncharacterized protein n=1 Tax=Heliothis virescens TaxID=7102 RepID=A0A2A4J363_HELVI
MNHGAFDKVRSMPFCNLCMMVILELQALPHNCIPYIHTGLRIILYIRSLLSTESFELRAISQYMFRNRMFVSSRLVLMCFFHVNLLSRCIPRYLTESLWGRVLSPNRTGEQFPFLSVKVMWIDLDALALMRHFFSQSSTLFRLSCRMFEAVCGSVLLANSAVSSANVAFIT